MIKHVTKEQLIDFLKGQDYQGFTTLYDYLSFAPVVDVERLLDLGTARCKMDDEPFVGVVHVHNVYVQGFTEALYELIFSMNTTSVIELTSEFCHRLDDMLHFCADNRAKDKDFLSWLYELG